MRTLTPTGHAKHIVVIGAGMAGLVAADEMIHAGHKVTVLEAKTHPGGRVTTLRADFADGLYAEAGAQYFYPTDPDYAMEYIQHFGLDVVPLQFSGLAASACLRGQRFKISQDEPKSWPFDLTPEEQQLGIHGLRKRYLWEQQAEFFHAPAGHWPSALLARYDDKTFAQVLCEAGASPEAADLLRLIDFDFIGEGETRSSALELLGDRVKFSRFKRPFYGIRGGNDLLPQRLAQEIGQHIRYGAAVTRIDHNRTAVTVTYQCHEEQRHVTADYAVVTIPFSVLRHVVISPTVSPDKRRAIQSLEYASVCRVYMQSRHKFWREEGLTGLGITDREIAYFWDSTWGQEGRRGVLQAYATGATARRMAMMSEPDRQYFALREAEHVYPTLSETIDGGPSSRDRPGPVILRLICRANVDGAGCLAGVQ